MHGLVRKAGYAAVGYRDTPEGERQASALSALERSSGRKRSEIVADLPMEHDQYKRYVRGDTPLRLDQIAAFAKAYGVPVSVIARRLGLLDDVPDDVPEVIRITLSTDWDEFTRQVESFPPEIREIAIRSFRESAAAMQAASDLVRRN